VNYEGAGLRATAPGAPDGGVVFGGVPRRPLRLAQLAQGGAQFAAEGHPAPLPTNFSAKRSHPPQTLIPARMRIFANGVDLPAYRLVPSGKRRETRRKEAGQTGNRTLETAVVVRLGPWPLWVYPGPDSLGTVWVPGPARRLEAGTAGWLATAAPSTTQRSKTYARP
jgi:hypothetical protein